jgi:hypothetical protein
MMVNHDLVACAVMRIRESGGDGTQGNDSNGKGEKNIFHE